MGCCGTVLVIETDTGARAHQRHHAGIEEEATINISYAPSVVYVKKLREKKVKLQVKAFAGFVLIQI